jgi:hypothetical protein
MAILDKDFSRWALKVFEPFREKLMVAALFEHVHLLEKKIMAQIDDLQAQIQGVRDDAAAEKAEVGTKISALLEKVSELEAAAEEGADLTPALTAIAQARLEVQNIFAADPVVPPIA